MGLVLATSMMSRLKGLLFCSPDDTQIILAPCNDIHTFGMRYSIDVAFVDKWGRVIKVCKAVPPNKRIKDRRAAVVIERFSNDEAWFAEGQKVSLVLEGN
jgi:hypothetical protein